jgi:hypothetical protein
MTDKEELTEIDFPVKEKTGKVKAFINRTEPYFRKFNLAVMLALFSTVFLFPYPDPFHALNPSQHVTDTGLESKTVMLPRNQHQIIFDNFNESREEGFCLFGKTNSTHIKIMDVVHNEDPVSQGPNHITNLCTKQVAEKLPRFYLDYGYKLIGNIHTHPISNEAKLSKRDIHSMGKMSLFQRVWGVANNTTVNFYTNNQLGMGIPVQYY